MNRFRSIPVDVVAIQWTGDNLTEIFTLTGRIKQDMPEGRIGIFCPVAGSAYRKCELNDWVVRYQDGRVWPMNDGEFRAQYAPAEEPAP